MDVRTKWINMNDADKCQYNGYNDFFLKETEKVKRGKLEEDRDRKDTERIRRK